MVCRGEDVQGDVLYLMYLFGYFGRFISAPSTPVWPGPADAGTAPAESVPAEPTRRLRASKSLFIPIFIERGVSFWGWEHPMGAGGVKTPW